MPLKVVAFGALGTHDGGAADLRSNSSMNVLLPNGTPC